MCSACMAMAAVSSATTVLPQLVLLQAIAAYVTCVYVSALVLRWWCEYWQCTKGRRQPWQPSLARTVCPDTQHVSQHSSRPYQHGGGGWVVPAAEVSTSERQ
jgi:hypothetical protein